MTRCLSCGGPYMQWHGPATARMSHLSRIRTPGCGVSCVAVRVTSVVTFQVSSDSGPRSVIIAPCYQQTLREEKTPRASPLEHLSAPALADRKSTLSGYERRRCGATCTCHIFCSHACVAQRPSFVYACVRPSGRVVMELPELPGQEAGPHRVRARPRGSCGG